MNGPRVWQFRISRLLGRAITRVASTLTLGRMPPFVSASAVVVDDGRILVVFDPIQKEPTLPGGHLKWAETPLEAVAREVREETGYAIEPQGLLGVAAGEELAGEAGVVRLIYRATITGGSLTSSPEGEALWLPIDEIVHSQGRDAAVLQRLLIGADGEQGARV